MGSTNMGSPQLLNLGKFLQNYMQQPQNNQGMVGGNMVNDFGAVSPNQGYDVGQQTNPYSPMVGGNMVNDFGAVSPNQGWNVGETLGSTPSGWRPGVWNNETPKTNPSGWRNGVWNNEPTRPMFGGNMADEVSNRYRGYNG